MPLSNGSNVTPVPVPSRLYSSIPPEAAPLRGLRIAIPDAMALKGVPTTVSSKAWSDLHDDVADSSAALVKRLVKLGAIIVGKTKSSQFGSGREWTDVAKPHNPREDGQQDPSGGSAGAAAALAGYEWMTASTGFDGEYLHPIACWCGARSTLLTTNSHRPSTSTCCRSRALRTSNVSRSSLAGRLATELTVSTNQIKPIASFSKFLLGPASPTASAL